MALVLEQEARGECFWSRGRWAAGCCVGCAASDGCSAGSPAQTLAGVRGGGAEAAGGPSRGGADVHLGCVGAGGVSLGTHIGIEKHFCLLPV